MMRPRSVGKHFRRKMVQMTKKNAVRRLATEKGSHYGTQQTKKRNCRSYNKNWRQNITNWNSPTSLWNSLSICILDSFSNESWYYDQLGSYAWLLRISKQTWYQSGVRRRNGNHFGECYVIVSQSDFQEVSLESTRSFSEEEDQLSNNVSMPKPSGLNIIRIVSTARRWLQAPIQCRIQMAQITKTRCLWMMCMIQMN